MASERVVLAVILGAHGVRGDVRIKSFTEIAEDCFAYGPLQSADGRVSIDGKKMRATNKGLIVTPKNPLQREEWEALKGTELSVLRDAMPETEDDEFYIDDLVGMRVKDAESGEIIGSVKSVQDFGAGDILEITRKGKANLMVPLTEEDVPVINMAEKMIEICSLELWDTDDDATQDNQES
ncbi:MAG: ribosome maturation factor RimM [Pseudomonadota bacterium]